LAKTEFALAGSVAVITGAAGGIGRSLALNLARRGCALALVDRDETGLTATAEVARQLGPVVSEHVMDLANTAAIASLPAAVLLQHRRVNLLVNNAGVALMGDFVQTSSADFDWLFAINFTAAVHATRAFLPHLLQQPASQIVNLSSIFGIVAPPGQSAYAAAKFAIRGFSEALAHELEATSVGVTVVHPGGVATNIARNAKVSAEIEPNDARKALNRFSRSLVTMPDAAAARIVQGILRRETRILIGRDARILDMVQRLAPVGYYALLRKRMSQRPPSSRMTPWQAGSPT
jgi:short-subunit dehydrogenase